ncbi:MAG TPA: hypothetical protein VGJ63_08645 [Micromonosporaceae bacterium]
MDFLSHDQVIAYERFVGDLSRAELEGFFLLDATALDLIAHKRGAHKVMSRPFPRHDASSDHRHGSATRGIERSSGCGGIAGTAATDA